MSEISEAMRHGREIRASGGWKHDQASRIGTQLGYVDLCLLRAFIRGFRRTQVPGGLGKPATLDQRT